MTARGKNMTLRRKRDIAAPTGTVAAGFASALMSFAISKGAQQSVLESRSQIGEQELRDQDQRIPLWKYIALMKASQEQCNDPALALHFGASFDFGELSIVGLILGASASWGDAFVQLNRYSRLMLEVDVGSRERFRLEQHGPELWMVDTRPHPNDFPELTESGFARGVCMSRRYAEGRRFVHAVHVTHAAPSYRSEYDRIFQVPVIFNSEKNALITDAAWLTQTSYVKSSAGYVFGIFSAHASALMKELDAAESVRARVHRILLPNLHTGALEMASVARNLGFSRDTLRRRLRAEGTTFEQLLDELRQQLASDYLSSKKLSVNETAYLLGFSEPSAFSRAFKRWTGMSPRAHARGIPREGAKRSSSSRSTKSVATLA